MWKAAVWKEFYIDFSSIKNMIHLIFCMKNSLNGFIT